MNITDMKQAVSSSRRDISVTIVELDGEDEFSLQLLVLVDYAEVESEIIIQSSNWARRRV